MASSAALATAHPPLKRKIAAILAADVAGYSRLVSEDEEGTLTELAAAREIFDGYVRAAGGRIFNTAGDSAMVEFDSAVEALRVAIVIQDKLRVRNLAADPAQRLEFRMGLTIGDVVEREGDLLGDGVNIAARLESLAPPGGICISRSVHEAVANKLPISFRELGPRQVKNIPQPIHAYVVQLPKPDLGAPEPIVAGEGIALEPRQPHRGRKSPVVRRVALVSLVLAGVFAAVPAVKTLRSSFEKKGPQLAATTEPATKQNNQAASPGQGKATPSAAPTKAADKAAPPKAKEPPRAEPPRPEPSKSDAAKPEVAKPAVAERKLPADPSAAFAALAREGVLSDAKTLPELYHNARAYEAKGDRAAALAAYGVAAPLAGEAVDVHLRHASLLRAAKGTPAVRETYAALSKSHPSQAAALVLALSGEPGERRERIEAYAAAHPGLADYLLADALIDDSDGGPTLTDRRLAFDALDRFLEGATSGQFAARFVDKSLLDGWVEAARQRRSEIETFFAGASARPSAAFSRSAIGWAVRLTLPEPASAISVRVGERGEFTSTGFSRTPDPRTGKPAPNLEFELPASTPRTALYVSYRDRANRPAGPFPIRFDPASATAGSGREALERYPESWVSFRSDIPDLLSFAGLASNRCAIAEALIGFGDDPPRDALPLPACEASGSTTMPSAALNVQLPQGTDQVQVKLTYADGSESQVRTFRRP